MFVFFTNISLIYPHHHDHGYIVHHFPRYQQNALSFPSEHLIRAKGNKYRVVMIKKELIYDLLKNVSINYMSKDALLFVNKKGTPLTQSYVSRIVEQLLFRAGIRKQKNGAHMLRHTFATLLYKKQKDLVLVQEALGHASLNTSRIYTHFDNDKLKLAAQVAKELSDS